MAKKIKLILFFSFYVLLCNAQMSNDLIPFMSLGKWGYADKDGKIVVEIKYLQASLFNQGYAIVEKSKNVFIKISDLDEMVSKSSQKEFNKFNNVSVKYSTNTSDIDSDYLVESIEASTSNESGKLITKKGNKYGVEEDGKIIVPFLYEDVVYVKDKYGQKAGIVKGKNNKWGIVKGNDTLLQIKYDNVEVKYGKNDIIIVNIKKKYGFTDFSILNRADKRVNVELIYDSYSFLPVSDRIIDGTHTLDYNGDEVIVVRLGKLFGLRTIFNITKIKFNKIEYIGNKFFRVLFKGKTLFINSDGFEYFN
jgi:WG containing repeat